MKLKCTHCDGIGLVRREVPHPGTREHNLVTVTRSCPKCGGWGKVEQPSLLDVQMAEESK